MTLLSPKLNSTMSFYSNVSLCSLCLSSNFIELQKGNYSIKYKLLNESFSFEIASCEVKMFSQEGIVLIQSYYVTYTHGKSWFNLQDSDVWSFG